MERMLEGLEQFLCKLDSGKPIPEITSSFEAVCSRIYVDGVWKETMLKYELRPDEAQGVCVPNDVAEAFNKLPVDKQELVCGCFTMPIPIGKSKNRDVIPRVMITMDRKTGMIVNTIVAEPPPDEVWKLEQTFAEWLQGVIDRGSRPKSICFEGWHLSPLAPSLCEILGVKEDTRPCPKIQHVFQSLVKHMVGSAME